MAELTKIDFDLAGRDFWERPYEEQLEAFRRLRSLHSPVFFPEGGSYRGRPRGYYALVTHEHVVEASKQPQIFSSEPGVTTPEPTRRARLVFGESMVNLDNPRHARLRRIVASAFTPRMVARMEDDVRRLTTQTIDRVVRDRSTDFVTSVASPIPFHLVCDLMGIPQQYRTQVLEQLNSTAVHAEAGNALRGRFHLPDKGTLDMARLQLLVMRLGRERRRNPQNDLISALANAKVDGRGLGARDLGSFFSLLLVAGVETTRNAIALGLQLLSEHPEQRALLVSDFDRHIAGAVDEILRFATPILQFRRTVKADYEMSGTQFRKGDKVVLYYVSANRDERVFENPDVFDITRSPNPHVSFGAGGPHICLGKQLALIEMSVIYRELFSRLPSVRAVGPVERVPSNFDNRIARLPFTFDETS